jgi:drug/metabolite transporter (DMT)-like permease
MNDRTTTSGLGFVDLGLLIYLGAVWGAAFLFLRVASPEVGPVWTAEIRIALAGIALAIVVGPRRLWSLQHNVRKLGIVGITFSAIPFSLLAFATLTLPAALASLLMATTPLFTALISTTWLRQRLSRSSLVGLAVGFAAVVVLLGGSTASIGPETAVAFLAGLGAALSYAVAGTYVRRSTNGIKPLDLAAGQLLAGAVVLLPIAILSGPPGLPALDGAVSLGLMALVSTAIAWPVFFRVSERTNATTASTVTFIVPMFGILWGGLILGEPIGPQLLVGFGLVLLSLVLVLQFPLGRIREAAGALGHRVAWPRQLRPRPTS